MNYVACSAISPYMVTRRKNKNMLFFSKLRRIRNTVILKTACVFFLAGFLMALSFFVNMSGGTMFLLSLPGTFCFLTGILLFLWFLYRDFRDRHALFEEVFLSKGALVFEEGTPMNSVCLVTEGELHAFQGSGKEKKPLYITKSDDEYNFVGELSIIPNSPVKKERWSESIYVASERAELIFIGEKNLSKLTKKIPLMGNPILAAFEEKRNKHKAAEGP